MYKITVFDLLDRVVETCESMESPDQFALDELVVVRAHINRSQAPLYIVEAQIVQAGQVKAKATGKFMERPLS